jgi:hypothetical protein
VTQKTTLTSKSLFFAAKLTAFIWPSVNNFLVFLLSFSQSELPLIGVGGDAIKKTIEKRTVLNIMYMLSFLLVNLYHE